MGLEGRLAPPRAAMCLPGLILLLAAAPTAQSPEAIAREILADPAYQTELPGALGSEGGLGIAPGTDGRDEPFDLDLPGSRSGQPVFQWLMWLLMLAVGLALAARLGRALAERRRDVEPLEERDRAGGAAPAARPSAPPLAEVEALAAEGRFGEAIHLLLLRTLESLRPAPSLTSREVLAQLAWTGERGRALAALVEAVELSLFGARVPDRADYEACLESGHALAAAAEGEGA